MAVGVITLPFCGSCGYDLTRNLHADIFCDACGADFRQFGGAGIEPPVAPVATPGSGEVSFAFTVNTEADSTESSESDDDLATWSPFATDTSPTVVSAVAGTVVGLRVRSVVNGINGAYTQQSDTTTA
jgi:hypothetical protein